MKLSHYMRTRFSSFQSKLLLAFLVATLLPLCIIACISYRVSYNIAKDKILESTLLSDDQLISQINGRIHQTEAVADTLRYQMYSLENASDDISLSLETFDSVRSNVSLYISTFDFYHIFVFLRSGQTGTNEGIYFFPLDKITDFPLTKEDFSALGSSSAWLVEQEIPLPRMLSSGKNPPNTILYCRALNNQGTGILEYAYCIAIDAQEFSQSLSMETGDITSWIVAPNGQIVAHADSSQNGRQISAETLALLTDHENSFFHYKNTYFHNISLDNDWMYITEIPDTYIRSNTHVLIQTLLLSVILFVPLTVLVIILFSQKLTKRLRLLSQAMESFQLAQDTEHPKIVSVPHPCSPDEYDEIDQLGITFEAMQRTISQNLKSIVDLSVREERLKYQLLQSQINPHFLYNILGSIRTCQSIGKLDIADQMITDLTAFYRLTLRKSSELIPIRDELEIARLYLNMEKLCHSDNLEWEIETEDGVENFMMCRFTLQPFLENCVHHGLSYASLLHICIQVCYGDDTVVITISDNGHGIPPRLLEQLRYAIEHKIVNYEKHFGISNVNARISNPLYGNGTIKIDSKVQEGTCVTIEFEQMEDSDEKDYDCR